MKQNETKIQVQLCIKCRHSIWKSEKQGQVHMRPRDNLMEFKPTKTQTSLKKKYKQKNNKTNLQINRETKPLKMILWYT